MSFHTICLINTDTLKNFMDALKNEIWENIYCMNRSNDFDVL